MKAEDQIVSANGDIFHDGECFIDHIYEHFVDHRSSYLSYLESEMEG